MKLATATFLCACLALPVIASASEPNSTELKYCAENGINPVSCGGHKARAEWELKQPNFKGLVASIEDYLVAQSQGAIDLKAKTPYPRIGPFEVIWTEVTSTK